MVDHSLSQSSRTSRSERRVDRVKDIGKIELDGWGDSDEGDYTGDGHGCGEENLGISGTRVGRDGFGSSLKWCKSVNGNGFGCGEGFYAIDIHSGDGCGYARAAGRGIRFPI